MALKQALQRKERAGKNLDAAVKAENRARWNWRHLAIGTKARRYARDLLRRAKANTRDAELEHAEAKRDVAAARENQRRSLWHPDATRAPHQDAGPFTVGRPKLVWHTTEGRSLT